jgi:hypothetical protein
LKTKKLAPNFSIPLKDIDPVALRRVLLQYIDEDLFSENQTLSDSLEKILKL